MTAFTLNFWGTNAIDQLETALNMWRDKFAKVFSILTTSPQEFQGGQIWQMILEIINFLQATGVSLLVIFFFYGLYKANVDYKDMIRPQHLFMMFVRIGVAQFFVVYGTEFLIGILAFAQSLISGVQTSITPFNYTIPDNLRTALESADWGAGMGAFIASIVGTVIIFLLSIIIVVIVYGRFFKIFLLAAISPIPMAGFASEATESLATNFLKTFIGECLRGLIILIACMIFSVFASSPTGMTGTAGAMTWMYVCEVAMQMLLLVVTVKGSDMLIRQTFGI